MNNVNDLVSDEEIEMAWGNADFGDVPKRDVIASTILKNVCGYSSGHFSVEIVKELGLISLQGKITNKGRKYLYAAYSKEY